MAPPGCPGSCPNFAVVCSFLERYGPLLDLPELPFPELERVLQAPPPDIGNGEGKRSARTPGGKRPWRALPPHRYLGLCGRFPPGTGLRGVFTPRSPGGSWVLGRRGGGPLGPPCPAGTEVGASRARCGPGPGRGHCAGQMPWGRVPRAGVGPQSLSL